MNREACLKFVLLAPASFYGTRPPKLDTDGHVLCTRKQDLGASHMQLQKTFRVLGSTTADACPSCWDVDLMMVGRAIGTEEAGSAIGTEQAGRVVQLMTCIIAAGAWGVFKSQAGNSRGCRGDPPARRQHKDEGGVAGGVIVAGLNGKGLGLHKAPPQGLRHKAAQGWGYLVGPQHAQRDNLLQGVQFAPPGFWQGSMVWLQAVVDLLPRCSIDCY